jgi:ABC-type sugar transport system ATPase subunit
MKTPKAETQERTQRVADTMGIGHLMDRRPANLSGGQQQRVALGRALVKEPGLLLFDEPLSNLDARLRLSMRSEIKRLQVELGITSIYVTHDQVEAMTMADRIAVISDGQLHAYDTPAEVYDRPRTLFIARFVGNPPMNFTEVEVSQANGAYHARGEGLELIIPADRGEKAAGKGKVIMGIRPENIMIASEGIAGEVHGVEPLGREHLIDVKIEDSHFYLLADPSLNLKYGGRVNIDFKMEKAQFFDMKTERSLLWN